MPLSAQAGPPLHAMGDGKEVFSSLEHDLLGAHMQPLWDRYRHVVSREPSARDNAFHWRWRDLLPFMERAVREVGMEEAERRVLMLVNPAFDGAPITTTNLFGGLQILEPGERALLHRHSAGALRFVLSGSGATTIVNGQPCEMAEGDLVLTPAWAWHEHVHGGSERIVWLDGLDLPLSKGLDTVFFQDGAALAPHADGRSAAETARLAAGQLPDGVVATGDPSPAYHYRWTETRRELFALPPAADGSRLYQYRHPGTGGAILPTLDCAVLALSSGIESVAHRSTANIVCAVIEGEGRSTIGGVQVEWERHDVFTVPHWQWAAHCALSGDAVLFMMTDREPLRRLGLLRDEWQT